MRFSRLLASTAVAVTMLGAAGAAHAEDGPFSFSGSAALTSDYVFRGYSQTEEDPAVQLGLEVGHESGFFAGAWGSNVDLGADADVELDVYIGYGNTIDNFSYSIVGNYYTYPGADSSAKYDFFEFGLNLEYALDKFTLSGSAYWSPEFYGTQGGDGWYFNTGLAYAVTDTVSVYGAIGFNEFDSALLEDYQDYQVGVTVDFEPFALDVKYVDTDVKNAAPLGNSRFVATLSYSF
ncbi:TorF family putative porin [Niveispirillum fermenti]|uniref:TorF family putative porin n=1 Tax=Niveispirillum fermenti TaxID=1233113 RepID=UPI003A86BB7A